MNAQETGSLASSIYIVARKMQRQPTGFYTPVKEELNRYLTTKLERLWQEGISGPQTFYRRHRLSHRGLRQIRAGHGLRGQRHLRADRSW